MRSRTPQQKGRDFEQEFAVRHGAREMPASGATPRYKLDVGTTEVIASLKHTEAESFRITAKDVRELFKHAGGPGSRDQLGVMVVRIEGIDRDIWIADGAAMEALMSGEVKLEVAPSSAQIKRAAARPLG